ncbi:hypothetical protein ABEB36_002181 [Hypothenemus hampei]|uniref:Uncharacterized protein n=1 Tax=Hypothenemus hampei TaxID=57062 RepID=A0ABD1F4U4_HYPHA
MVILKISISYFILKMLKDLLSAVLLVISPAALGRPQQEPQPSPQQQSGSTPIPIVSQSAETKEDGGFSYSFETGNGIKVEESGNIRQGTQGRSIAGDEDGNNTILVLQGSFSYQAPDGQLISLRYVADENGFQPEGAHLPTNPPNLQSAINLQPQQRKQQQQESEPTTVSS